MQAHHQEMIFSRGQANARTRRSLGFSSAEVLLSLLVGTMVAFSISTRFADPAGPGVGEEIERDLGEISAALHRYYQDNEVYPTNAQGLEALIQRPGNLPSPPRWRDSGYLERMPLDPWGNRYRYLYPGLHGDFDVYSLGADNAPGGQGEDADIGNWAG
jgi:general secretion pathway protein G